MTLIRRLILGARPIGMSAPVEITDSLYGEPPLQTAPVNTLPTHTGEGVEACGKEDGGVGVTIFSSRLAKPG